MKKIGMCFISEKSPKNYHLWKPFLLDERFSHIVHPANSPNDARWKYSEERVFASWGHNVEAELLLFRQMLEDQDIYKIINISDSCCPITTPDEMYKILTEDNKSYIQYRNAWWTANVYRNVKSLGEFQMGNLAHIVLNRGLASFFCNEKSLAMEIGKYQCDSECFYATALNLAGHLDLVENKCLTYVDWGRQTDDKAHPYTFSVLGVSGQLYNQKDKFTLLKAKADGLIMARRFYEGVDLSFLSEKK